MLLESIVSIHAHHILDKFVVETQPQTKCGKGTVFWICLFLYHAILDYPGFTPISAAAPASRSSASRARSTSNLASSAWHDMGQWKYNMHPWAELENIRNNLEVHVFCLLMCDIYTLHEILCKWLGPFKTPACFRRLVLLHQSLNLRFQLLSCL